MPNLPLWVLVIYGLTFIAIDAELTERIRGLLTKVGFFKRMLSCYFCTGTWMAAVAIVAWILVNRLKWSGPLILDSVFYVVAGAAGCYGIDRLITFLEMRSAESHSNISANNGDDPE